jgi:ankyrin repeat protein
MPADETPRPRPELDEETLAFARKVFQHARSGEATSLATLLDQGFPPNLRNERGDSLLMLACYHGHVDAVRTLLEHGADPELQNDAGQTPLGAAAFKGDLAIATLLLERGAQVDSAGPNGKTALMLAAMFNRSEIALLLLSRGANPFATDAAGVSIPDAAKRMGADDTYALLSKIVTAR